MEDLAKQLTQLEMMENTDIIRAKFAKKFKIDIADFSPILKLPENEQDDLLERIVYFWNTEYAKLKRIPDKDVDVFAQIVIYEQTIHRSLQAIINTLPDDRQKRLIISAKEAYDKKKEERKPKSKEEMKKINDSFLPDHLKKPKK